MTGKIISGFIGAVIGFAAAALVRAAKDADELYGSISEQQENTNEERKRN